MAIALTVIMFSVGEGLRGSAKSVIEETGVDLFITPIGSTLFIFGGTSITIANGRQIAKNIMDEDFNEKAGKIRSAYLILTVIDVFASKNPNETEPEKIKIASVSANGVIPEMAVGSDIKAYNIISGNDFREKKDIFYNNGKYGNETDRNFTHEVIINEGVARFLEVNVGETIFLSADIEMKKPINFTVRGISRATYESPEILTLTIHLGELQYLTGKSKNDDISQILIDLKNKDDAKELKNWFEKDYIETKGRVTVFTQDDLLFQFGEFIKIFEGFSQMISVITTIVALMFTSTVMILSVRERTGEIGMLRAIGFSKESIFKTILIESVFICFIGFALGMIIGYAGSIGLDAFLIKVNTQAPQGLHFVVITPLVIFQLTLLTVLIGIFSGLIPAYRASSLNIAKTLKEA